MAGTHVFGSFFFLAACLFEFLHRFRSVAPGLLGSWSIRSKTSAELLFCLRSHFFWNIARMLVLELIEEGGVGFLVFWLISAILNIDSSKSSQLGCWEVLVRTC